MPAKSQLRVKIKRVMSRDTQLRAESKQVVSREPVEDQEQAGCLQRVSRELRARRELAVMRTEW